MNTPTERILHFIELKGISKRKFCTQAGLSTGFLNTVNDIGSNKLINILNTYPEINPTWLLTGDGDMLNQKCTIGPNTVSDSSVEYKKINNESITRIPLVDQSAIAGFGNADFSIGDQDVKEYYVVPKFKTVKIDFMIEVRGSSMYPRFNSGDVIACRIIRESKFIQWNKCHVIATYEQGILVKRLKKSSIDGCLLAVSDNQDYDPIDVPTDEITGLALVVGIIRSE